MCDMTVTVTPYLTCDVTPCVTSFPTLLYKREEKEKEKKRILNIDLAVGASQWLREAVYDTVHLYTFPEVSLHTPTAVHR